MDHLGEKGGRGYPAALALVALVGAVSVGCQEPPTPRVLALGDSYTIGEGVAPAERWPALLVARLRADGLAASDPQLIARTGWTTDDLLAALERARPAGPFDLVTLLVGVNDQFRGRPLADTRARFVTLLERAEALAGGEPGRVLVLSVPDWGVTCRCVPPTRASSRCFVHHGDGRLWLRSDEAAGLSLAPAAHRLAARRDPPKIAREIDALNAMEREEVERRGARWLDVTPISRLAADDAALLARDGLHPSGAMYARWAEAAAPQARAALQTEAR